MTHTRRQWIQRVGGSVLAAPLSGLALSLPGCGEDAADVFLHGVASGDPLPDAVILWTRVTSAEPGPVEVVWELASDPDMANQVATGIAMATPERDMTVKVDATGLSAGTTYYYRFEALGSRSMVGRTRTAPTDGSRLRMGVVSCANYAHGYFHAYRHLAEDADLDLVVHLGDYIYEYGNGEYGSAREMDPPHEILTLEHYRRRYQHYRLDPDLQAIHQQHPMVCVWDDHEITNNAWREGAENHMDDEGDYAERKAIAYQVYAEYLPIRELEVGRIWRSFGFGGLMDLLMLDTRIVGRDEQLERGETGDPSRSLLGAEQREWLSEQLESSSAQWKVLGQQVMLGQLSSNADTFSPINPDQWDGYPQARAWLHDVIEPIDDVVVLTGDIHTSWAIDIVRDGGVGYDPETGEGALAAEFVTTSVTSESGFEGALAMTLEGSLKTANPHIKHVDLSRRGYSILDVTPERLQCDFFVLDGTAFDQGVVSHAVSYRAEAGRAGVIASEGPVTARADAPALAPGAPVRDLQPPLMESAS